MDDCIIDVSATGLVSVIDGILAAEIIGYIQSKECLDSHEQGCRRLVYPNCGN